MVGSGTIKTLAALVAAMSVTALLLIGMETAPARPTVPLPLQATGDVAGPYMAVIRQARTTLPKWRNVFVHDAACDGPSAARGCHFVIAPDGSVQATARWVQQQDGQHVTVPGSSFNANSIGVCLLSEGRGRDATGPQLQSLVDLVRDIQVVFQIPPDHVYLHGHVARTSCPGPAFPAQEFRGRLLPAVR